MYGLGCCSWGRRMFRPIDLARGVVGAAVGGLHDARPAAGHHHEVARRVVLALGGDQAGELAGGFVVMAPLEKVFGPLHSPAKNGLPGRGGQLCLGLVEPPSGLLGGHDPRAPIDHDRRANVVPVQVQFRLEQLQFDPRGAHLGLIQKIDVLVGHAITGRLQDFQNLGGAIFAHGGNLDARDTASLA